MHRMRTASSRSGTRNGRPVSLAFFERVGPRSEKKGKGSDGRVLPGSQLGPCTFEAKQSEWLMKLMQRQGAMLGEAFDERIDLMQEDMTSLGKEVIEIKNNQAEMATKEEVKEEVRKNLVAMRVDLVQEIKDELTAAQHAPTSPARSASSTGSSSQPAGPRTFAILGGLGWDIPELQLLTIAKKVLLDAGVPEDRWTAMSPACRRGGCGSMVELKFLIQDDLEDAKLRLRCATGEVLVGAKSLPWLDYKKTREERRPTRVLRCAFDVLKTI